MTFITKWAYCYMLKYIVRNIFQLSVSIYMLFICTSAISKSHHKDFKPSHQNLSKVTSLVNSVKLAATDKKKLNDSYLIGPFGDTANSFGLGRIRVGMILNEQYFKRPETPSSNVLYITPGAWYPISILEKITLECSRSGKELIKQIHKIKGNHKKDKGKYQKQGISLAKQFLGLKSYKVHNAARGYNNIEIMVDRNKKVIGIAVIKHYATSPGQKVISQAIKKKLGKPLIEGGYSVTKLIYEGKLNDKLNLEFYEDLIQNTHKNNRNKLLVTIEDLSVNYLAKSVDELKINYENSLSDCIKSYRNYLKQEIEIEKNKASEFQL